MTRPKVPPENRQRIQQACNSCKKRKQKCNGLTPCETCSKRGFDCNYDDRAEGGSPATNGPPAKKRMTEANFDGRSPKVENNTPNPRTAATTPLTSGAQSRDSPRMIQPAQNKPLSPFNAQPTPGQTPQHSVASVNLTDTSAESAARSLQHFSATRPNETRDAVTTLGTAPTPSAQNVQNGNEEEATVYTQTRMLQDPTGRLLYVGDAATLSFLQLIRMMVETVRGPSPFTTDPRRHKIMESQLTLPPNARNSLLIPHKTTAMYLADAYFTNTHGLIHIFNRKYFYRSLDATYTDPLAADPNWLCLLNLVFAIGLTMAAPAQGTPEAAIIEKLRMDHVDRAEVFYLNAKSLNDPMRGLEDADFWSVQALILMTMFMLAKSKRNAAFALLGMAIRSAYALGLHREETLVIFNAEDQAVRRNVWRSLFVMDRFLSCSLGRPPGISEDECSGDILLKAPPAANGQDDFGFNQAFHNSANMNQTGAHGLEAAVRSCSVIGKILKQIYQKRKVSTKLAQDIADICKTWPKTLAPSLHWRQAASATPSQGIAILHVNLLYCHSIVLLTRPFFLFVLNDVLQQQNQSTAMDGTRSKRNYARMEKFSEACVIASTHTVVLVQNAHEAGYLPRRNPFVIYFLFAAALILMSNEFSMLYINVAADQCIRNSITIMEYCAGQDAQAGRLVYILSTFRDVLTQQRDQRNREQQSANQLPPFNLKANINPYGPLPPRNPQSGPTLPSMSNSSNFGFNSLGQGSSLNMPPHQRQHSAQQSLDHSSTINLPGVSLPRTGSQPPSSRPLEPSLASPIPPNPLSPHPSSAAPTSNQNISSTGPERQLSFSNIFDLGALNGDRLSISEESSGPDEHIDFDALWAWPSNTPAVGSPRTGLGAAEEQSTQKVGDSAVPLFPVSDIR